MNPLMLSGYIAELSKRITNTSYSPRIIDDTITFLKNMFVISALQYESEYM